MQAWRFSSTCLSRSILGLLQTVGRSWCGRTDAGKRGKRGDLAERREGAAAGLQETRQETGCKLLFPAHLP